MCYYIKWTDLNILENERWKKGDTVTCQATREGWITSDVGNHKLISIYYHLINNLIKTRGPRCYHHCHIFTSCEKKVCLNKSFTRGISFRHTLTSPKIGDKLPPFLPIILKIKINYIIIRDY